MKIKLYNKIAKCGLDQFPTGYEIAEDLAEEEGIVVRSADLHEVEFPAALRGIARAGAGAERYPQDDSLGGGLESHQQGGHGRVSEVPLQDRA